MLLRYKAMIFWRVEYFMGGSRGGLVAAAQEGWE
jgi:hypothetical protein